MFKFFLISLFISHSISSQELTLVEAIHLCEKSNFEIKAESFAAEKAATDLQLLKGEMLPKISTIAGVGPIDRKFGSVNHYQKENGYDIAYLASLEFKLPLFIWGRSKNLEKAIQENIVVNKQDEKNFKLNNIYKLKEAYFGLQYVLSLQDFVKSTSEDLNAAYSALQEKKSTKKEDLLKLEVFKYQVQEKLAEIKKNILVASAGIHYYIGDKSSFSDDVIALSQSWIEFNQRELLSFNDYLKLHQENAPDLIKANHGLSAKNELLSNEKKAQLPSFGLLIKYDWADTKGRTPQNNPYIFDRYNRSELAMGLGFTWELNFGSQSSKIEKLSLEVRELNAKVEMANNGLSTLLYKSYLEVKEKEERVIALRNAYKAAKKWLSNVQTSAGLGLIPVKDIIDAYTTRALVFKDYYEAIYNYELAWAKLSKDVGLEIDPSLSRVLETK